MLAGGPDYKVSVDIGGAIFSPLDGSPSGLEKFQPVAVRIIANDGLGYSVRNRHRSSDHAAGYIDLLVINIPR